MDHDPAAVLMRFPDRTTVFALPRAPTLGSPAYLCAAPGKAIGQMINSYLANGKCLKRATKVLVSM